MNQISLSEIVTGRIPKFIILSLFVTCHVTCERVQCRSRDLWNRDTTFLCPEEEFCCDDGESIAHCCGFMAHNIGVLTGIIISLVVAVILVFCFCCLCCPFCLLYKRRHVGTLYGSLKTSIAQPVDSSQPHPQELLPYPVNSTEGLCASQTGILMQSDSDADLQQHLPYQLERAARMSQAQICYERSARLSQAQIAYERSARLSQAQIAYDRSPRLSQAHIAFDRSPRMSQAQITFDRSPRMSQAQIIYTPSADGLFLRDGQSLDVADLHSLQQSSQLQMEAVSLPTTDLKMTDAQSMDQAQLLPQQLQAPVEISQLSVGEPATLSDDVIGPEMYPNDTTS